MAKLTIITGYFRNQTFELENKGWPSTLGRDAEQVDIAILDPAVSRKHAQFSFRDGQWAVQDTNSANGIYVNERKIKGSILLKNNDQIRFGMTVLLFESEEQSQAKSTAENSFSQTSKDMNKSDTLVGLTLDSLKPKKVVQQQQRMAEAGQTAVNMSHGIKNVLQAVSSGRDVVDYGLKIGDIERVKRGWNILNRNLARIQKLVINMLKYSRESKPEFKACQFNRVVESAIDTIRPVAEQKGVKITIDVDDHLGIVQLDSDKMQDVIINLVINAVDAVVPDKGAVHISTRLERQAGKFKLIVSDNGSGMTDTESIFLPFHSAKAKMGTGLGLSIARKIVHQHSGTIEVQSKLGEGSTFTVSIPLVNDTAD